LRLLGQRVWITGASKGIGRALAVELAARGCRVAASARDLELLEQLASDHPAVVPVVADVTDREAMLAAAARVEQELGAIDVVVLNAGYWRQMDVAAWDSDAFRRHLDTNLMGMAHGVEAVLPGMRRRRRGLIVGVASLAGVRGFPRSEAYGATKAAQINLLESLRLDLQPLGIRVQTVCPGFVRTELTAANAFKMPFMLEPDDAARRIARGIERGSAEIAFPLPMAIGMRLARAVPAGAYAAAWRHRARKR
jgi:NAD(P)-dependent dehydrogenase (short-subunit alcohol dehydrogenase family)